MPTYDYECNSCCNQFEEKQHFDDEPVAVCPVCRSSARRVINSVPIVFKGSGFYITDHGRGNGRNSRKEGQESAANKEDAKTEAKAEAKPAAKTEAKAEAKAKD